MKKLISATTFAMSLLSCSFAWATGDHIGTLGKGAVEVYGDPAGGLSAPQYSGTSGNGYHYELYSWADLPKGDKDYYFEVDFSGFEPDAWSYITIQARVDSLYDPDNIVILSPLLWDIRYSSTSAGSFTHIAGFDVPLEAPERIGITVSLYDLVPGHYLGCARGVVGCQPTLQLEDYGQVSLHFALTTITPHAPEPGTVALVLAGVGIAGVVARRRGLRTGSHTN